MPPRGWKSIVVREEVYDAFKRAKRELGFVSDSDFVLHLLEIARSENPDRRRSGQGHQAQG